jgi:beta-N-acetylglucosaminidase
MKKSKICIIILSSLCAISIIYIVNQYQKNKQLTSEITSLKTENEKIKISSKELKNTIDIMDKNIISLEQELKTNSSFNSFVHFNPNNITEPSGVSYEQLAYALKDTKLSAYIDSFLTVEKNYGINSLAMIGIVANESAWLNSDRTQRQNNVTGYAVYSDSSKGVSFSSIDESILTTAKLLQTDYINPQGRFYNGLSVSDVNIMYSSDVKWNSTVASVANQLKDKINEVANLINS